MLSGLPDDDAPGELVDFVRLWESSGFCDRPRPGALPVLDDPCTKGWVLALVRQVWRADFIDVVCEQANDPEDGGYVWRANLPGASDVRAATEGEVLIAALEAASRQGEQ